ncbi:MAG: amino acid ABC transporter permease [Tissierellia bacterium]|nr:amino acid ABC transporter permease [Tissierellia bacterium]
MFLELSNGFTNTILIFILTLLFSLPLGIGIYYLKSSKILPIRALFSFFVSLMRGTPLMLQLMFVYFGPYYIFGFRSPDRFFAVIVTFSLNYSCYFAEIYRGGFEAIHKSQFEAAKIMGLSKALTFRKIILPQVIKIIIPSITNEVITLVKDTSLAMVIAVSETFTIAKSMAARDASISPYVAVAIFYFFMNYLVEYIMKKIERKIKNNA